MKPYLFVLILLCFTCSTISGSEKSRASDTAISLTQAEQDWLEQHKELTYVYDPDWQPFEWKNEIGLHTGIVADLLQLISQKSGITLSPTNTDTWSESVNLVKSEQIDMFSAITKNRERETYLHFTKKDIFTYPAVLLTQFDDPDVYLDIKQDFTGKQIGTVKDSGLGAYIRQENPTLSFVEVASTQDGFLLLSSGQIDLFAINTVTAKYYILKKGFDDLKIAFKIDYIYHLKIGTHKTLPLEAVSILDKSLASISDEEKNAIFTKWTDTVIEKKTDWQYVYQLAFVTFLLSSFFFVHTRRLRAAVRAKTKELRDLASAQERTIEKRTAEIEQVEIKLRQSQKMEAIGQLTGGIAHDFNNLLGIIMGNVELLNLKSPRDSDVSQYVASIDSASRRAADLTNQLLGFSRIQATDEEVCNLNDEISDMGELIERSITPELEVELQQTEGLWMTRINRGDFQGALVNLILNARDAMPGGGRLTLETRNRELDSTYCDKHPETKPGEYVEVAISDTGSGMTAEQQEKIYEPFYTTKPVGKGTGLGLSLVFGFVTRSKGCINVESTPGRGTTFHVLLPRALGQVETGHGASLESLALPQGNEVILAVDDEPELLELARVTLENLGYSVLTATNGKEALLRLADNPSISLLFSDIVMPGGVDGYELMERATEGRADLKVLLTSGHTEKAKGRRSRKAGLLVKPYTHAELARRVRLLLDGS